MFIYEIQQPLNPEILLYTSSCTSVKSIILYGGSFWDCLIYLIDTTLYNLSEYDVMVGYFL